MQISTCLFMSKGLQASCQSTQCVVLKVFVFFRGISGCSPADSRCPVMNKRSVILLIISVISVVVFSMTLDMLKQQQNHSSDISLTIGKSASAQS